MSPLVAVLLSGFLIINQGTAFAIEKSDNNKSNVDKSVKLNENVKAKRKYTNNEVIVKYKNNTSLNSKQAIINKFSNSKSKNKFNSINAEMLKLPENITVEDAIKTLKENKDVESVQPNYIYYPQDFKKDARSGEQWGLENVGQTIEGQSGLNGIDISEKNAWSLLKQGKDVVVGIVDTGIDINHPDLKDKIWTNTGEIPGNGIDDDNDGYIDDVNGWNFYNNNNSIFNVEDGDEHATHVAGIIAAATNSVGVVGVSNNVKIMPLKFMGEFGGTTSDVIKAIEYAKSKGVKILNFSFGGSNYDPALKSAIDNSGCLIIVAAGNESSNNDSTPVYPASYKSNNIITVAAVDNQGNLASFSNYGQSTVDIAAPGLDILSTVPKKEIMGASIQSNNGTFKTMFQGFGMESVKSDIDRKDLMSKALNFFGVSTADSILLVQDDEYDLGNGFTNVRSFYENTLTALGYNNITVKKVAVGQNGPNLTTLRSYKLVIWATGGAEGDMTDNIITSSDQSNLKGYLQSGGNLYLSGENTGEYIYDTDIFKNYLHAKYLFNDMYRGFVQGNSSTLFNGKRYELNLDYKECLKPYDSLGKVALSYEGDTNYDGSYEYFSGTSMAAPFVTGVAALIFNNGITDPILIKQKIMENAKPLASLTGKVAAGGIVNAYGALRSANYGNLNANYVRLGGNNRYETSIQISKDEWSYSDNVILATGDNFPDALSAAPLAKKYGAPILLTEKDTLTPSIEQEIDRLKVKNVFIIGGEGVISKAVENRLKNKSISVTRLAGVNRYETSLAIANFLGKTSEIVVATGENFPDALSIASLAGNKEIPILLTEASTLPTAIKDYISSNGVNKAYVVGGTGVIGDQVLRELPNGERISGLNRYETNINVVNRFSSDFDFTTVYYATGENFPDALAGSVVAALNGAPIILVNDGYTGITNNLIKKFKNAIYNNKILGGEGVVHETTISKVLSY